MEISNKQAFEVIAKLDLHANSVILVDVKSVDVKALAASHWAPFPCAVLVVDPPAGKTLQDCIATVPIEQLRSIIERHDADNPR